MSAHTTVTPGARTNGRRAGRPRTPPRSGCLLLQGGILAAASTVTAALVQGTTAVRFVDLGAGGTRTGWTMVLLSLGGTLLGLTLVIGATAVVSLRTQLFALWFAVASGLLVLLSLVGAFTIGSGSDALQIIAGLAVILDSVWILLVSAFMWRNPQRAAP